MPLDKARGVLKHYGTLFRDTPGHLWRASDTVSRLVFLGLVVAGAVGYGNGVFPASFLLALIAVLVVVGLAVSEYDRHEAWKKDSLFWRRMVMKNLDSDAERLRKQMAWDALEESINEGRDNLYVPITTTSKGSNTDWIAAIDQWDSRTVARLEKHFPTEVDFYRSDIKLVEHLPDVRDRLETTLEIKLNRLKTIFRRSLGLEDGEPTANSPAG